MAFSPPYDSVAGYSKSQVAEVCEYPDTKRWIFTGSGRRKRMRIILSCVWYYEMTPQRWYTTDEICQMCMAHDSRGTSAMVISNQRIGTLLRVLIARGLVDFKTVRGKREYMKGEKYENEMQQL